MEEDKSQEEAVGRTFTSGLSLISTYDEDLGIHRLGKLKLRGKSDELPQ